jgi:hypothetical protein
VRVPALLRDEGLQLVTLAERYGVPADEGITDEEWLADAGRRGEAVLMKDTRIRYNPAEKAAVAQYRVRCFCLARADLPADEMARRFVVNLGAIVHACGQSGPFVYAVHSNRIERLSLSQ